MWLKNAVILSDLIKELTPDDGNYHDIQVVNQKFYVDGILVADHSHQGFSFYQKALSKDLTEKLLKENQGQIIRLETNNPE